MTENLEDFIWTGIHQGIDYWAAQVKQLDNCILGMADDEAWSFTILELTAVIEADPNLKELIETGQYDCDDADMAFQMAAFGEIRYA